MTTRQQEEGGMMRALISNLPAAVCFAGAVAILLNGGTEGWGWLIVAGILVS
jgi:hypothetical protein